MIAFLGTGLLGANFVRALRERGEDVQVWNRTHSKAVALEQYGARPFADVAEAVRGASRVHLTLPDDAVVDEVLERALPGLSKDTIIIDHTTTSPLLTAGRAAMWKARGIRFLHAPVFMGPPNALASTGTMLASGDRWIFDAVSPELAKMTGNLVYLNDDPSHAAAMKLMGNHFIVMMNATLGETVLLAKSMGVPKDEVTRLFEIFNPGAAAPARLKRILQADYQNPSWTLNMARKDVRLMQEAAERGGETLPTISAVARQMEDLIGDGHGDDDYSIIAKRGVVG